MKKIISVLAVIISMVTGITGTYAQTTTYILLRHAEKDTMKVDPPLTKAGEQRAQKLVTTLKDHLPDLIYSTNYARTKATAAPLAAKLNKEVQMYDPRNLTAFADLLLQQKGKTILVVGHSNTAPALANLLIKENLYKDLDDSDYDTFFIITIKEGEKPVARRVTY